MANTFLSDTFVGTGNRRIFTHSFWIKRFSVTGGGGTVDITQSGIYDTTVDLTIVGDNFDVDITQSD